MGLLEGVGFGVLLALGIAFVLWAAGILKIEIDVKRD